MFVYLIATLDTKGPEAEYVRDRLVAAGVQVRIVDAGCLGEPTTKADVSREDVFAAAGSSVAVMREKNDRGAAIEKGAHGVASLVKQAHERGEVVGVISLGGSAGTTIGTTAMRALPLGVPKVMVSTLASGNTRSFVGDKNLVMINSVVDIAGINRISRIVLDHAAAAMAGMLKWPSVPSKDDRPLVAATMFGVTTPCVQHARSILEKAGCEVLVFHATGSGGQAMESLIRDGAISGVLDVTTTELADQLVGGVLSAGPTRLTAAGTMGIPQVVSVGALDMVNFGPIDTVPEKFRHRKFHVHNANITLMRTTADENAALGKEIAEKLTLATGPVKLFIPLQGVSAIDRAGQPFDAPSAKEALFTNLRNGLRASSRVELDLHINDPAFAEAMANELLRQMAEKKAAAKA